eukprot:8439992-Heterocapsa_arctica.AAC.1
MGRQQTMSRCQLLFYKRRRAHIINKVRNTYYRPTRKEPTLATYYSISMFHYNDQYPWTPPEDSSSQQTLHMLISPSVNIPSFLIRRVVFQLRLVS